MHRLHLIPATDRIYEARLLTGFQSRTYGSAGAVEIGAIGTITSGEWGGRLWFIVVTHAELLTEVTDPIGSTVKVRFSPAMYYRHDNLPRTGNLHSDARFYAVPDITADPLKRPVELAAVADLYLNCSLPLRPDAMAASDNCNKPAISAVKEPEGDRLGYRCSEHEGLWRDGVTGKVLTTIPQTVEFS